MWEPAPNNVVGVCETNMPSTQREVCVSLSQAALRWVEVIVVVLSYEQMTLATEEMNTKPFCRRVSQLPRKIEEGGIVQIKQKTHLVDMNGSGQFRNQTKNASHLHHLTPPPHIHKVTLRNTFDILPTLRTSPRHTHTVTRA